MGPIYDHWGSGGHEEEFFTRHLPSDESIAACVRRMEEIARLEHLFQVRRFDEQFLLVLKIRRD